MAAGSRSRRTATARRRSGSWIWRAVTSRQLTGGVELRGASGVEFRRRIRLPTWRVTTPAPAASASRSCNAGSREATAWRSGLLEPGTPAWTPDDTRVGLLQREQGITRLLLYPVDGGRHPRRVTLPAEAVGPGVNEAQWSGDGKALLIASAAGIRVAARPRQRPGRRRVALARRRAGRSWRAGCPARTPCCSRTQRGLRAPAVRPASRASRVPLTWRPAPAPGRTIIRATRVFDGSHAEYLPESRDRRSRATASSPLQPWFTATPAPARHRDRCPRQDRDARADRPRRSSCRRAPASGSAARCSPMASPRPRSSPRKARSCAKLAERWQSHAAGPRLLRSSEWCGAGDCPAGARPRPLGAGAVRLCPAAIDRLPALVPRAARCAAPRSGRPPGSRPPPGWSTRSGRSARLAPGPAAEALAGPGGVQHLYQDAIDVIVTLGRRAGAGARRAWPAGARRRSAGPARQRAVPGAVPPRGAPGSGQRLARGRRARRQPAARLAARQPAPARAHLRPAAAGWPPPAASPADALRARPPRRNPAAGRRGAAAVPGAADGDQRGRAGASACRTRSARSRRAGIADLLIIDGDPLADLRQLLRIETVMVDGHALRRCRPWSTNPLGRRKNLHRHGSPEAQNARPQTR